MAVLTDLLVLFIALWVVEGPGAKPHGVVPGIEDFLTAWTLDVSHLRNHLPAALSGRHPPAATQNRGVSARDIGPRKQLTNSSPDCADCVG